MSFPLPDLRQSFISRVSPLLMNGGTVLLAMCGICDLDSPPQIVIISGDFQLCVDSKYTLRSICRPCTVRSIETDISLWLFVLAKGSNFVPAD